MTRTIILSTIYNDKRLVINDKIYQTLERAVLAIELSTDGYKTKKRVIPSSTRLKLRRKKNFLEYIIFLLHAKRHFNSDNNYNHRSILYI